MSVPSSGNGLVLLERFASVTQAELARMHLAEAGISSVMLCETASGWRPELQVALGVELRVAAHDYDVALGVLQRMAARRRKPSP